MIERPQIVASDNISFIAVPVHFWKTFLPAWLVLPITPFVLLEAANADRLNLYYWLIVAPVLAVALWPSVRLWTRNAINYLELVTWTIAGVLGMMCLAGAIGYAYRYLKAMYL